MFCLPCAASGSGTSQMFAADYVCDWEALPSDTDAKYRREEAELAGGAAGLVTPSSPISTRRAISSPRVFRARVLTRPAAVGVTKIPLLARTDWMAAALRRQPRPLHAAEWDRTVIFPSEGGSECQSCLFIKGRG